RPVLQPPSSCAQSLKPLAPIQRPREGCRSLPAIHRRRRRETWPSLASIPQVSLRCDLGPGLLSCQSLAASRPARIETDPRPRAEGGGGVGSARVRPSYLIPLSSRDPRAERATTALHGKQYSLARYCVGDVGGERGDREAVECGVQCQGYGRRP